MTLVPQAEVETFLGIISAEDKALLSTTVHPAAEAIIGRFLGNDISLAEATITEYLPFGESVREDSGVSLDVRPSSGGNVVSVVSVASIASELLQLSVKPVAKVGLRIWEDIGAYGGQAVNAFPAESELVAGVDFFLDVEQGNPQVLSRSGIVRRVGVWPTEPRCIKVQYTGGATASMLAGRYADLRLAVLLTIAANWKTAKSLQSGKVAKTSESIGKYSYSKAAGMIQQYESGMFTIPPQAMQVLSYHRNYAAFI